MYIDKFLTLRQLNKDADGGGGTPPAPFVSLEDLDNITPEEEAAAKKAADLEAAAAKQQADEAAAKAEEEKKAAEADKQEPKKDLEPDLEEGADDTPEGDDDSFWADVDKLRGETIDVDFGDVDPTSPEGVLIYEKAVRADEIAKFEAYLEKAHPRAYAYMSHILDGGKDEDFFKLAGQPVTLPTEAELENDIELQKEIVTRNLKAKGNSDKQIERIIKGSIQDDDLEEMSKDALKEESERERQALEQVKAEAEQNTKFREEKIREMADYVGGVVATGKIDNVIVPEKDRAKFAEFFSSSIRIENNKFVTVTEISNENIAKLMKEKFFSFKNGDLTDLIQKAAATANTKRLQRTINTTQKKPMGNGQKGDSGLATLAEMED